MNEDEARIETIKLFGEDSFTEEDDAGGMVRYYIGALPKKPGTYTGFMGFSWEEALKFAENDRFTINPSAASTGSLQDG